MRLFRWVCGVVCFFAFFVRAQDCTTQPWIASSEFHPSYGYWKPIEFHTNGYRVVLLYENPQTPVGEIKKYVVAMGTVGEPGMKLVYQSPIKISLPRINHFGDVAFYQENIPIQDNGRSTYEHRLSVCLAEHTGTSVNPDYNCLYQSQTLKTAHRVAFTRASTFLGANSAADGAVTSLDWSQTEIRKLHFTTYSLDRQTTSLKNVDYFQSAPSVSDSYWEPISVIHNNLPSTYLRIRNVDSLTDYVGTIKQHFSPGFLIPMFGGWSHMVHGQNSAIGSRVDFTNYADTTNNGGDSSGTFAVVDNLQVIQQAFYARRNLENTGVGLYYTSSTDNPAYSVERRVSPVGSAHKYNNPLLVNGSTLVVSVNTGIVNNVNRFNSEFYRWNTQTQGYDRAGSIVANPQNNFIHVNAYPRVGGGVRILGFYYDIWGQNPRIAFYDCL